METNGRAKFKRKSSAGTTRNGWRWFGQQGSLDSANRRIALDVSDDENVDLFNGITAPGVFHSTVGRFRHVRPASGGHSRQL